MATRTENDPIRPEIFDRIEGRLRTFDSICDSVSSHLAHSGNAESRTGKSLGGAFDIRQAREAIKGLRSLASLLGTWFANDRGAGLATYIGENGNQFAGLDAPLVSPAQIKELEARWLEIEREIEGWSVTNDTYDT